jgi:hypothetical protein
MVLSKYAFCFVALTLIAAAPPGEKPKTSAEMAGDVVTTPLSDINLKKREIPPLLLEVEKDPYSLAGMNSCNAVIAEVEKLNTALGPDFDETIVTDKDQKRGATAMGITGGVIQGLIPFRGLIREISGANKAELDFRTAIYAGVVRRGFLKGYGAHRRCRAPGRPMTDFESARLAAATTLGAGDETGTTGATAPIADGTKRLSQHRRFSRTRKATSARRRVPLHRRRGRR